MSACFNCVLRVRYCQQASVTPLRCPHMCDCDCQHCWKFLELWPSYYWETRLDGVEKPSDTNYNMKLSELVTNCLLKLCTSQKSE